MSDDATRRPPASEESNHQHDLCLLHQCSRIHDAHPFYSCRMKKFWNLLENIWNILLETLGFIVDVMEVLCVGLMKVLAALIKILWQILVILLILDVLSGE